MPIPRLFLTATFRLAMAFTVVFVAGVFALLLVLQWAVSSYASQATDDTLRSEMALIQAEAARLDEPALAREFALKAQSRVDRPLLYLIAGPDRQVHGGNLPPAALGPLGFGQVQLPAPADAREFDDETMTIRTLAERTADGGVLVVGRSTYALDELNESLGQVTLWGGVGLTLMAIAGGLVAGGLFIGRLERVNLAAERIMSGRLDERLPSIGFGAEFDRLSASLNRMLDRLQASMEGLRQVSADFAHDLRTPLGHLRQRLERAKTHAATEEEVREAVGAAIVDIDEVLAIFGSLLRIAQLEGGTGRHLLAEVDLSAVLERVADAFRPGAEDAGRALDVRIEPGVVVTGDAVLLGQLFSNLIDNAVTHTDPCARLRVALEVEEGRAVARVSDDGPGVPPDERGNTPRRFYRLDRSRTTPGAGLGLAMAAAIAELHGAPLTFADNAPGLTVELRFPQAG